MIVWRLGAADRGRRGDGRLFQKGVLAVIGQQRLDGGAESGDIAAGALQERRAFRGRWFVQRLQKEFPQARAGWLFGHAHSSLPTNAQS